MDFLPNEVIGAWTRLGCRAALVGTNGVVTFTDWAHLARFLGVAVDHAEKLSQMLPSVHIEEGKSRHDAIAVTFKNWTKYQIDSTQAERSKTSRSKRRGEETRREKTRQDEKRDPQTPHDSAVSFQIPESIRTALTRTPRLAQAARLHTPEFWRAQILARPEVDFPAELLKAEAWLSANPKKAPRSDVPAFLQRWFGKAAERLEDDRG